MPLWFLEDPLESLQGQTAHFDPLQQQEQQQAVAHSGEEVDMWRL